MMEMNWLTDFCEQLAMATLGAVVGGATIAMSGKKTQTTPPIQAGSSDEEKFIKYILTPPT